MTSAFVWVIVIVGVVYVAALIGVIALARWQRKTRWPFKAEDRLLRGPGEHLRQRIAEMDEKFLSECVFGMAAVLVTWGLALVFLLKIVGLTPQWANTLAIISALAAMAVSLWRVRRLWQTRADHYLGWFGERLVGEQLQLAATNGWRIFHDVPFVSNGAGFNIDHIAVGLGGLFVIETKTRRKGFARPGFDDAKAYFDGHDLVWPWGEDNHGLEQAERNALWLADWIKKEIGEKVYVSPILALPGWWLENKPTRESRLCRVVNPKWLPSMLAKERPFITAKQVELIALRLEVRCRDVEY